jgi:HSP20 family protein
MLPVLRRGPWAATATEPIQRLRGEFDTLFDSLFDRAFGGDGGFLGQVWSGMPVAVWEDDDHVCVEVDLPGVAESDVEVTVHNGRLYIQGERKPAEGRTYRLNQRFYGRFERVIDLPETVGDDNVQAQLTDGVLTIRLTKSPQAKPKKIAIQATK